MTPRPHDALFKSAFEDPDDVAPLLRDLLPAGVREAIAWETRAHEPGSFVDLELGDLHNDLLFSARLRAGGPARVFFLLEHQSTSDPDLPLRGLAYQHRIWDRARKAGSGGPLPAVITVLVSHVPGGWRMARSFEELFDPAVIAVPGLARLVPRYSMLVEDLDGLSNEDLKARSLAAFQQLTLWLLRDARDSARLLRNFDVWIPELEWTGQSRPDGQPLRVLFVYMYRVIDPASRDKLRAKFRKLSPRTQEIAMSIADLLHQEGFEQGLAQGLARGRLATLRSQLLFKFGALDAAAEARLAAAPPEALDRYLRRVLTADSLAAVLAD